MQQRRIHRQSGWKIATIHEVDEEHIIMVHFDRLLSPLQYSIITNAILHCQCEENMLLIYSLRIIIFEVIFSRKISSRVSRSNNNENIWILYSKAIHCARLFRDRKIDFKFYNLLINWQICFSLFSKHRNTFIGKLFALKWILIKTTMFNEYFSYISACIHAPLPPPISFCLLLSFPILLPAPSSAYRPSLIETISHIKCEYERWKYHWFEQNSLQMGFEL